MPLSVAERTAGALNLYSRAANTLTEANRAGAAHFAAQAAGAVALALQLAELEERERHLETALRSRSVIDQAMGVLIGQAGIAADEAFEVLRLRSQCLNVKLRDVAAEVIAEARQQR
jgi:AmiR/NasT family two-component response regulator